MIRIKRCEEPEILKEIREKELARVRKITNPTSDDIGKEYRKVVMILWQMQDCKCCYCELGVHKSYNDVEHYRPKARAVRLPGSAETYGYWWLAWSWGNLLFACSECNRSEKNHLFPLAKGSKPLCAEDDPPGEEEPLIIDPAKKSGVTLIRFVHVPKTSMWIAKARNDDPLGVETIKVLGLNRDGLIELYAKHFKGLRPTVSDIKKAAASGDEKKVKDEWKKAKRKLRPFEDFAGLTYDIFDHFFPREFRERWGLDLRIPGGT